MPIANSVSKEPRYKKESSWATAPGASGAQLIRRVTSAFNLKKDTYESNEIRPNDRQRNDMRHGTRRVDGTLSGELSPATYKDFMAAVCGRDFAAVSAISSLSITVAGSGPYTLTRGSGSWITDGIKVGDVVRLTAGSFNANNLNKNILVTGLTATVITGVVVNASTLTAEGPIASATLSIPGKKTYQPNAGSFTDDSFYFEHWFSDISQSEMFSGCKVTSVRISLPPTGLATIEVSFIGKDMTDNTSAYYSSPTAETTTGLLAAVNGLFYLGGSAQTIATGLDITITREMKPAGATVGSNTIADIFEGRFLVDGSVSLYFQDATARDYFVDETEVSLVGVFTTSSAAAADFIGFSLPRIKLGGADKGDSDSGITQTLPFTALFNNAGGSSTTTEKTTLVIQDSAA